MKKIIFALVCAGLTSISSYGQLPNGIYPWPQVNGLPGTCQAGQHVTLITATYGANEYVCGLSNNWILSSGLAGVVLGGTPSTGQVVTATGPGTASWQSVGAASVTASAIANSEQVTVTSGSGAPNVITGTTTTTYSGYIAGIGVRFVPAAANTGATTINVNGSGAVAVTKNGTAALTGGELQANQQYYMIYDGVRFQILAVYTNGTSGQALTSNGTGGFGTPVTLPAFPSGTIVGNTDTQTLTNKSISGSEINSGTVGSSQGGAGNTNGILKANGSGVVSQASDTDLAAAQNGTGGGTAQAQTVSLSPSISSLTDGLTVCWTPSNANSGSGPTLQVSGIASPPTLVKTGGAALAAGDLTTTAKACAVYNLSQTRFELQNPQTSVSSALTVEANGTPVGSPRSTINFIPALGVTNTISDTGTVINVTQGADTAVIPTKSSLQSAAATTITTTSSSATTYTGTTTPTLTTYTGAILNWIPGTNCTAGAITLNINGLGAVSVVKSDGATNPTAADCTAANIDTIAYDGSKFRITGGGALSSGGTGTVTSITLAGTTNQITVTGTCTVTVTGTCTLSLPTGLVLPGTVNGLTITTTTGTLTLTAAKVLSVSNSLTLAGTDGVTLTFPATNATIARTDAAQTFSGVQTFSGTLTGAGAAHTSPVVVVATSGSLPASCAAGELGFVTGATAGQNIYECSAVNTWTQQLNSGGGGFTPNIISNTGTATAPVFAVTQPISTAVMTLSANVTTAISVTGFTTGEVLIFQFTEPSSIFTAGSSVAPTGFQNWPGPILVASTVTQFICVNNAGTIICSGPGSTASNGQSPVSSAPATPPTGIIFPWCDTTDLDCEWKNSAGSIFAGFLKGVDANPITGQITSTHLSAALPVNQGGTGTTSTLTGILRGNASAMTAAELSGDATTSGSNAVTVTGGSHLTSGSTIVAQKFFGTAPPGSVAGNLPGDTFSDTTNHNDYWCNAVSGTAAPACTSVTTGGWTQNNGGSSITLQTNGSNNSSQSALNLIAGSNVTLSNSGSSVTINSTGGGGGGGGTPSDLCSPYVAGITDGVGNNTTGALGHGTSTYYFGASGSGGYCRTAGAATTTTIDGTNPGVQLTWSGESNSATLNGTLTLNACPVANFTAANVGGVTAPCSSGEKVIYTTGAVNQGSGGGVIPNQLTLTIVADQITAGTLRVNPAAPKGITVGGGTSILVGSTSLTSSAYDLYWTFAWQSTTTGTVACLGTTTTSGGCISNSNIIWGPAVDAIGSGSSTSLIESKTAGTGGVTINTLVNTDTSNPSQVVAATGTGGYGIAQATVAATAAVNIARYGQFACVVDTGGATAGHLVIAGSATVIDCKDSGQTSGALIPIGTRIIGQFQSTASAGATALVELSPERFGTLLPNPAVTITTGTTATLSTPYTFNQEATAATAVAYTLPTASAGAQYCVDNSYNGSAANTGVLTVNASATGQFIEFTDGTLSATGGNVVSGGAARDGACFSGIDTTHWMFYPHSPSGGTWSKH